MITVAPASPRDPGPRALLQASHALMEELFPSEANHYLDLTALEAPTIRLYAASENGETLATGALAIKDGYGEVKSMFTAPAARGKGAAAAVLTRIEETARAEGLPLLRLETGTKLHAAHRLYARAGFIPCGRFGEYPDSEYSLYMEKSLG